MSYERYDYLKAVKDDVRSYFKDYVNFEDWNSIEELKDHYHEVLWICDSVTGNASGSYTCNHWEAEEYLCHNWALLEDALEAFYCDKMNVIKCGAEWCDVTIRCYLLGQAIDEVVEEFENDFYEMLASR